ncbi:MAG: MerR family transcriptional regulator [Saccharofermentanales bacterium]
MEYSINRLAKMAGISSRTLRYYDEIGLLKPLRISSSGYRIYNSENIDILQQILFYRELGIDLEIIKRMMASPDFDRIKSLSDHLAELQKRREQMDVLIRNVTKTISTSKGEKTMSDKEKFEGFKQKMISENEERYGKEIRKKYGNESVDKSNAKVAGMTSAQFDLAQRLSLEISDNLKAAFAAGDPSSALAQKVCELHKQWLCMFWPDGSYNSEAHMALAQSYVDDPRFTAYYDKIAVGSAVFLRDAINIFCKK